MEVVHDPHEEPAAPGTVRPGRLLEPLDLEGARRAPRHAVEPDERARRNLAEMAIRLAKAFGGKPETWLKLQMQYELAEALQHEAALKLQRVTRPAA